MINTLLAIVLILVIVLLFIWVVRALGFEDGVRVPKMLGFVLSPSQLEKTFYPIDSPFLE